MSKSIPELYGSLVFNDSEMKARLPKDIYKALAKTINSGSHLELDVANSVAVAMKEWALEHGATHFTHWFQPMLLRVSPGYLRQIPYRKVRPCMPLWQSLPYLPRLLHRFCCR